MSLVYLYENQVRDAFNNLKNSNVKELKALACGFDGGDVFHVYTAPPKTHISGYPCHSIMVLIDQMVDEVEGASLAKQLVEKEFGDTVKQSVIILIAVEVGQLRHKALVVDREQVTEGEIKFIPDYSDLYTRTKGLLETSVLEDSCVGIVGLGSGGSTVAVELAKSGVGNFVLIDFDRLEIGNISRHACGIGDLGRYKTNAVRDLLYARNPYVKVETAEIDINQHLSKTIKLLENCNLIIAATDNDRSRLNLNDIAIESGITTLFGRAISRAAGGDILRVRPLKGPCLNCIFSAGILKNRKEEISQLKQARSNNPAYVADDDVNATVQVGLSSDILPISNMIVTLSLLELSRGKESGISSLEEDLIADFYIWANRREASYHNWGKMEYGSKTPSILRWYGAKSSRNPTCSKCGHDHTLSMGDDNIFMERT